MCVTVYTYEYVHRCMHVRAACVALDGDPLLACNNKANNNNQHLATITTTNTAISADM